MTIRRATLGADPDDLALLEQEARRRGVSLAQVLARRPRFGVARTREGAAQVAAADEPAPLRDRSGT